MKFTQTITKMSPILLVLIILVLSNFPTTVFEHEKEKNIDNFNGIEPTENTRENTDKGDLIVGTSIVIIISTYLYDWIHGKYMLERKQELIRYRYSIKLKIEENKVSFNNSSSPYSLGLALTLNL